jgi:serine/threonine-protein kinase NIM1
LHEARSIIQKRKKASFWCSKSRKTSPISPFHQPIKQPEPIECYTKKYNNVPVEKFKNPLENDAPAVIPMQNSLSALSRNNSLINTSKNIKKRNGVNGVEVVQSHDILQVKSYSNYDPTDESSVEGDKDFDKFMMLPTRTHCDANLLAALDPLEVETRKIMKSLGIGDILLEKNIEQGPRSEVIGIYRIIIMRLKTQKENASIISHLSPVITDKLNNNHHQKPQKTKKKQNATKCAIL